MDHTLYTIKENIVYEKVPFIFFRLPWKAFLKKKNNYKNNQEQAPRKRWCKTIQWFHFAEKSGKKEEPPACLCDLAASMTL